MIVTDCTPTEIREQKVHASKIEYPQVIFPLVQQHGYRVYAGEPDEPFITIDDRDFTPSEFARLVGTFGGWGMRIVFVPDDELHAEPMIEVREPSASRRC